MNRLFLRFYAMLAAFHFLAVVAWFGLVAGMWSGHLQTHLSPWFRGPVTGLAAEAAAAPDADAWASARSSAWHWPIRVADVATVPAAQRGPDGFGLSLETHGLFVTAPMEDGRWLEVGPLELIPPRAFVRWLLLAGMASTGIAVAAWLGLRPIQHALTRLQQTALRLGDGELSARAGITDGPGADLASALDGLAERVERLLALQRDTLQGVSHELRTPLTRVRFGLELVVEAEDREARERAADSVGADLELAEHLLDELLSWLRLESAEGAVRREVFDWGVVLAEVAREENSRREGVEVSVEGSAVAPADPRLVRRAVRNLVANAVRAARARVWVRVSDREGRVAVTVEDDGPGLGPDLERWFQPFTRGADAREVDPGGVGLGLTLVRRIAQAHSGSVEGGAAAGGGARFVWSVPVR